MTLEGHIDTLTSLADDAVASGWLSSPEVVDAIEAAADSMSFVQSLWNLVLEHGLVTESDTPDTYKLEKVIDSLYGELAAVTLLLSIDELGMGPYLDRIIALFDTQAELLTKANPNVDYVVPPEVISGFRAFAARLRNAQKLKLLSTQEKS